MLEVNSSAGAQLALNVGHLRPALLEETIGARFAATVRRFPDLIALKSIHQQFTYKELDEAYALRE
ncbi:AMP-binding enzyme C-terminal domain [Elasticomyces elasticus]|nr:AMP-binding enzyme C-terminal domain [Elasticomyces elasticus]